MLPTTTSVANPPPILTILHELYQAAYEETVKDGKLPKADIKYQFPDILSLAEHLHIQIKEYPHSAYLDETDLRISKIFGSALAESIAARKKTVVYTSFVEDLTKFFFFTAIWMIEHFDIQIDLKLTSRRKALTEELSKLLESSIELANRPSILSANVPQIRDFFGLRLIFDNLEPLDVLKYTGILVSILVDKTNSDRIAFENWVISSTGTYGGEFVPKELLLRILSYTFRVSDEKDYITKPTENGYQSWHCTLTVLEAPGNPNLVAFPLEIQSRNYEMHINAEVGSAPHWKYEQDRRPLTSGVFKLDNYKGGLSLYNGDGAEMKDLDMNGLGTCADVLRRHLSPHVVPMGTSL